MGQPQLVPMIERAGGAAIVFVHGFGGDATQTWGDFPAYLGNADGMGEWSIYSLGYSSNLAPDIRGVWEADPGIETLGEYLRSRTEQEPLKGYDSLVLIAHSMGGLVVQKALIDYPSLVARVSHVLLYGTPSGGLKKADGFLGRLFKRQTADMGLSSDFIRTLRAAWREKFGDGDAPLPAGQPRPFGFWAVGGDRDDFVPATSSLGPFAKQDRVVVPGNHLEIVKPGGADSMSVHAAIDAIVGGAAPGGPWNSARVAIEMGDFHEAIERLWKNRDDLDVPNAVYLALALERVGRRDDAIEVLETRRKKGGTDAMGTLAGRFKRIWWAEGTETPAKTAQELYQEAYDLSTAVDDHEQAFYHGINVAFMKFAFERDEAGASAMAQKVLDHCAKVEKKDVWCLASMAEAQFYLGDSAAAVERYRAAVATSPEPWQMRSMYTQAMNIADALDDDDARGGLRDVFRQGAA